MPLGVSMTLSPTSSRLCRYSNVNAILNGDGLIISIACCHWRPDGCCQIPFGRCGWIVQSFDLSPDEEHSIHIFVWRPVVQSSFGLPESVIQCFCFVHMMMWFRVGWARVRFLWCETRCDSIDDCVFAAWCSWCVMWFEILLTCVGVVDDCYNVIIYNILNKRNWQINWSECGCEFRWFCHLQIARNIWWIDEHYECLFLWWFHLMSNSLQQPFRSILFSIGLERCHNFWDSSLEPHLRAWTSCWDCSSWFWCWLWFDSSLWSSYMMCCC